MVYKLHWLWKKKIIKVYASARKQKDVDRLKELGFEAFKINVKNKDEITYTLKYYYENDLKLDAVFNNAMGFGQPGAVEDISVEVLKTV